MLRVQEMHVLRHKVLIEGKSRREVAREMGIRRNTDRRHMEQPEPVARKRVRSRPVRERVRSRIDDGADVAHLSCVGRAGSMPPAPHGRYPTLPTATRSASA